MKENKWIKECIDFFDSKRKGYCKEKVKFRLIKNTPKYTIYDWGNGDIRSLKSASLEYAVEVPKKIHTLDLKEMSKLFRQAKNVKAKGGLKNTLELFDLKFYGRPHDGLDDAFNTALLLFKFEEMINFVCGVEKQFGDCKIRGYEDSLKQFEEIKKRKVVC